MELKNSKERKSGIELLRIIAMILIVAHHYVVNSGILPIITHGGFTSSNVSLILLGGYGKIGINCFMLITGYFMCKSSITLIKFLKLFLWVEFYKIIIYIIFLISGYQSFNIKDLIKVLYVFTNIKDGFISCFLLFYLFIPFLNMFIKSINKQQYKILLLLVLTIYTFLSSAFVTSITYNYITWFSIIYLIGAYIRLYTEKHKYNYKVIGVLTISASLLSIIFMSFTSYKLFGFIRDPYYFVSDCNKILSLFPAIFLFLYFKKLNFKSLLINKISSVSFGVLLIHANSDIMRQWLWKDLLNNVSYLNSNYLFLHVILSVLCIYCVCSIIDYLRLKYIERPLLDKYNNIINNLQICIINKLNRI